MSEQRFDTGKMPHVTIAECLRDLVIRGWSEPQVEVTGDRFTAEETEKGLHLTSQSDLVLMVPEQATLSIGHCHCDLIIKGVTGGAAVSEASHDVVLRRTGPVTIGTVHHDLAVRQVEGLLEVETVQQDVSLRQVQDVKLGTVHGDLSGRLLEGDVFVATVMGDLALRQVQGDLTIGTVHRDVSLRLIGGLLHLTQGMGDLRLRGGLPAGKHTLKVERDIVVRWPAATPLQLTATAPVIKNQLALEDLVEEGQTLRGRLGEGGATLNLEAGGRLILKPAEMVDEKWFEFTFEDTDFDVDWEGLGARISAEVNQKMADFNERMSRVGERIAEMSTQFGPEFAARFESQAQRAAERAAQKAERLAERALHHAERAARMPRHGFGPPPPPPPRKKSATSAQEQLKILKMLEKGTISLEEASTLLDALED